MSPAEGGGLFDALVRRPVAVTMAFLAVIVFGYVSLMRLPVELMPDISYPTITVRTVYDGAAPQEIEAQISEPIEEALSTLDGLVSLESRSRAGNSDVVLGFDWGTDMADSAQSVRESLQMVTLPDDSERPLILRYDPSYEPFMRLAVAGGDGSGDPERDLMDLREIAEREVKRSLEALEGVAAARVRGGLEREVRVEVRQDWLAARRLSLDDIRNAIAAENVNLAGGSVLEGDTEYLVRTLNAYGDVADIESLRIRRTDGVEVPLVDVAVVRETPRERTVLSRLDGAEAIEIEVFKEADANVVAVAERVRRQLERTEPDVDAVASASPGRSRRGRRMGRRRSAGGGSPQTLMDRLPERVSVDVLEDRASFIELAVANLRDAVLIGAFFAVAVLYLFLRDLRATGIIGLSIPVSVVVGFGPLYLWGVSLNLMSLGGLALGVGMLVDNAVVVLESIQRYREQGLARAEASVRGASDVAAAVIASTLTTVAVFAPIAFVEGVGGELFGDLSLAVVGSLLTSLAVALFLVPTLAALSMSLDIASAPIADPVHSPWSARQRWADQRAWVAVAPWRRLLWPWIAVRFGVETVGTFLLRLGDRGAGAIVRGVSRVAGVGGSFSGRGAGWFLARFGAGYDAVAAAYGARLTSWLRRPFAVVAVALLLFAASVRGLTTLGTELLPEVRQGIFTVELAWPVGTPLQETAARVAPLEAIARQHPEVVGVFSTVGTDGRADAAADEGEHTARLRVRVRPGDHLGDREALVMRDLREAISASASAEMAFRRPVMFAFRTPLEVVVYGRSLDTLKRAGDAVRDALAGVSGVRDVRSSLADGHPEIRISYDRSQLARFGLDTAGVAQRVRDTVQGSDATVLRRGEQRLDVRIQLDASERASLDDLMALNVNPNVQPPIPLAVVAKVDDAVGPSEIRRVDQQRAVVVSANLDGFDLGSAAAGIQSALASTPLPEGVRWDMAGQVKEMGSSLDSMRFALGLAVFLVYVIMASTFEHLLHPFVILFSVPLALIGVTGGLWLAGLPLGVVVFIGLIVLAGVVVNNAIVLVDAINRFRAEGLGRLAAIERAGEVRLRPILITTATTVCAMLPLAFGSGAAAEVQRPLAVTIIAGLSASTLLTLVVIPAVYAVFTRGYRRGEAWTDGAEVPS